MTVLETIRKVQERDEPTARLLLEMALFDALGTELDRIRPQLDAEVSKAMSEKAAQGLLHLARQPRTPETIAAAEALIELQQIAKRDGDNWDWHGKDPGERDPDTGQFVPKQGGLRRGLLNAMAWATGSKETSAQGLTRDLAAQWTGPDADKYTRASSLGRGLIRTNDPNLRPVGTVARLIGDIGPEAQKALEPGIRRSAYRYRGTERRPTAALQQKSAALAASAQQMTPEELKSNGVVSTDQAQLEMLSRLGSAYLIGDLGSDSRPRNSSIPDRDTAAISLAAGKMPPSVGVMFDADGRVVTEAMGFNGDHYLPFDLANLKRMKGGSYVRTRTTGGLTDEDIYTGLMTGARHVTVVSNSGVFTLEFDPDLRGGRRYSDKARQMVDRYSRLVGAIESGELYQRKLPQDTVQSLRTKALEDAGGNAELARDLFKTREKQALQAAAFTAPDEDDLLDQAEKNVQSAPGGGGHGTYASRVKEEFNRLKAKDRESTARLYRLDGEGYHAAQKALQTEFPYFIRRSTFKPLQDFAETVGMTQPGDPRRPRGGTDMGYTPHNDLSPKNAGSLGSPPKRASSTAAPAAPAAGTVAAASTAAAAPATGGQPGSIQEAVKAAMPQKRVDLSRALQSTVKARVAVPGKDWAIPIGNPDGSRPTLEQALQDSEESFVQWLADEHQENWTKITDFVLNHEDPRVINKLIGALGPMQQKLRAGGVEGTPGSYDDKAFADARKTLEQIKMLKKPFREGDDVHAEVELGQQQPQGIKEITSLPLTNEALLRYANENDQVGKTAVAWAKALKSGGLTHEGIGEEIRQAAEKHKAVIEAGKGGPLPLSLTTADQPLIEEFKASPPGTHPLSRDLETMHKAWALIRLHEVMEAIGANRQQGTGAADPFGKAAGAASPPSRVRWLSPAQLAVVEKAVAHQSSPSLRPVRRRVSR